MADQDCPTPKACREHCCHGACLAAPQQAEPVQPVAWAEDIINDLHALHDTEMIQEIDSGAALIRLNDAIAVVEDAKQKAALAQAEPVQGPFALPCPTPKACREHCCSGHCIPRATSPQQAEPLTPEWIWSWLMDWCKQNGTSPANYDSLFKMVPDARAALAEPVQPVEWMVTYYGAVTEKFQDKEEAENFYRAMQANYPQDAAHRKLIPTYTAPQQQAEPVQPAQESAGHTRFRVTVVDNAHPSGIPLEQWVQRKPLTGEELQKVLYSVATSIDAFSIVMTHWPLVARATEAAHGIKESK